MQLNSGNVNCTWGQALPVALLPAHAGSLGMRFEPLGPINGSLSGKFQAFSMDYVPGTAWIAQHGSWNKPTTSGYQIGTVALNTTSSLADTPTLTPSSSSNSSFEFQPQILGFDGLKDGSRSCGRPVDIIFTSGGVMLFSDDLHSRVYKVLSQT